MSNIAKIVVLICLVATCTWLWSLNTNKRRDLVGHFWAEPMQTSLELIPKGYDETRMKKEFHYLKLSCQPDDSQPNLGDRSCWTYIESFNGIPALNVAFFSRNNLITNIRIVMKSKNFKKVYDMFSKKYGSPAQIKKYGDNTAQDIIKWILPNGYLLINDTLVSGDETTILWIAKYDVNSTYPIEN